MFGNFLYFITALLIHTTYKPSEEPNFALLQALLAFLLLGFGFAGITRIAFLRLAERLSRESFARIDHRFNVFLTRHSIAAVVLFAVDIYVLNLSAILDRLALFRIIPTLQAVVLLGLFALYLSLVWGFAHTAYRQIYRSDITRREYVLSNLSLGIPVLFPWFVLSGIGDLIRVLPFEGPIRFLSTPLGELSYFLVFLFVVAVIGPGLIQKFWRCRSLEYGIDRLRIEAVCRKAGLKFADILYWPLFGGRMITAAVMGLVEKFRYILVTEALLKILSPEEVEAVIAHEIGHVKKKHLLFYLFFFAGYMLIAYVIFDLIVFAVIYFTPVHRLTGGPGFQQTGVTTALFSFVIILVFLFYFRFIFGYFMRNFERQADTYVYAVLDNAQPLISTLEKIAFTSGQPPEKPNWHHFSIRERIDYLRRCETDRRWIRRHDRKIRKSFALYIAAILFTGGIGYQLSFGDSGNRISSHFFERVILRELEKHPDSAELHGLLGDLHYSRRNIRETVEAYERSLSLAPDSPKVLNNLAWLYATSEEPRFRDPPRSLDLARRAAEREPLPYVLDTLAESYFVNGMYEEAIEAATRALALAGPNRAYYEGQLKRFREGRGEAEKR